MRLLGPCDPCRKCGGSRCVTVKGRHRHAGAQLLCPTCYRLWWAHGCRWDEKGLPVVPDRKARAEWANVSRARRRRERIGALAAKGRSARSIAIEVGVSERTVRRYS